METRDFNLLELRGKSFGIVKEQCTHEELFQNNTLRPILKLQNDLLISVFKNYATKQKTSFYKLTIDKKLIYIEHAIQRDIKFRNVLKGMIIGFFTIQEFEEYIKNSSNLNKRMIYMLTERLKSNVQLL